MATTENAFKNGVSIVIRELLTFLWEDDNNFFPGAIVNKDIS